ncbi:MAG: hypothetical protein N2167_06930 [Flavobacteriales bacterium]|nr:hypothetical protein [Flavobacteriales bacterium]
MKVQLIGILLIVIFIFSHELVIAQTLDSLPKNGFVQASLFYPLGTSWKSSKVKTYHFSLNVFNGITGGINGVEIGPISNITLGKFNGMQVGGVNVVKGPFNGFQVGLLTNVNLASTKGFQLSGLWTHNHGDFTGFQFSWFGNTSWGNVYGAQLSHLWNHAQKSMYGHQFALGPNTVRENAYGIQFSATINYARQNHVGVQFSFLANYAKSSQGFQLSSINLAPEIAGIQAGLFNYTGISNAFQGGIVNIARKSGALQVGLVNYSGDSSVATIGLINIVKRGYNKLELWGGELQSFNIAIKTGGRRIYSMLNFGINPFNENIFWTTGWGIGTHISISKRFYVDVDNSISLVHINEPISLGKGKMTLLNQSRFMAGFSLHRRVALFIGPMINMILSDNNNLVNGKNGIELAPTFRTAYGKFGDFQFAIWPGIGGGFRFF